MTGAAAAMPAKHVVLRLVSMQRCYARKSNQTTVSIGSAVSHGQLIFMVLLKICYVLYS